MFEKVNPKHPDKIADRIAGAILDLAYNQNKDAIVAVEVLIGHGECHVIIETDFKYNKSDIEDIIDRVTESKNIYKDIFILPQDSNLNKNQIDKIRCGDNGIFKGTVVTKEQTMLCEIAKEMYRVFNSDGKYIIDLKNNKLIICQSNATDEDIKELMNLYHHKFDTIIINPLGYWTGGTDVDTGATNRKLGSDMGDSVTGGGIAGKDLSKADVSVNIYAWLKSQETGLPVEFHCAIGDECIDGKPYEEIVKIAKEYIQNIGGFEKFAEWGLVRQGRKLI